MQEEFYETVSVEQVNLWKSAGMVRPVEGYVRVTVNDRARNKGVTLECFVYEELEKWQGVKLNERVLIKLVLLNWTIQPQSAREKSIRKIRGYEYNLQGQIVEVYRSLDDRVFAVVDCGVYVETQLSKNVELKVGDYLSLEGRLDAHIVGKVN